MDYTSDAAKLADLAASYMQQMAGGELAGAADKVSTALGRVVSWRPKPSQHHAPAEGWHMWRFG